MCKKDPSCRDVLNQLWSKCQYIADWNESVNDTEPVCTEECKRLIMNISKTHDTDNNLEPCCINGKISDDSKLEDVREIIRQHRMRNNGFRFCSDSKTIPEMCEECRQQGKTQ